MQAGRHGFEANPESSMPRRESVTARSEVVDSMLPRKASKFSSCNPYRKPTQVGGYKCTKALERTLVKELGKITP